jgi:hypothetical protein
MLQRFKHITTGNALPEYQTILDFMLNNQHFTPDIVELESQSFSFVFVADECMTSLRKHSLVNMGASGFYPFCGGYTAEEFSYIAKKTGVMEQGKLRTITTPIPMKDIDREGDLPVWMTEKLRIKGEIYALRGCSFLELDKYKHNGVQFQRVPVTVNIPYFKRYREVSQTYNGVWSSTYSRSKDHIVSIKCHMYVGRHEYWLEQLKSNDGFFDFEPVKVSEVDRVWIKKFYDYKNHDR